MADVRTNTDEIRLLTEEAERLHWMKERDLPVPTQIRARRFLQILEQ